MFYFQNTLGRHLDAGQQSHCFDEGQSERKHDSQNRIHVSKEVLLSKRWWLMFVMYLLVQYLLNDDSL